MFPITKKFLNLSTILLFAAISLVPTGISGYAQADSSKASIGISPARYDENINQTKSWFIEKLKPGETVEREYIVYNYQDQENKIRIHVNDAAQTTDGSFTYLQNQEESKLVGKWASTEDAEVTVPAKSQKTFKMKLSVPQGTPSGEYAGVISAQLPGNTNPEGVTIESRIGARIYVTVGDDLKLGTEVSDFKFYTKTSDQIRIAPNANSVGLSFDLKNSGNIFTKTYATLKVQTPSGEISKTFDKDLGPGDAVLSNLIKMDKGWEVGKYKATIEVSSLPIVGSNKGDIKDQSSVKSLSAEFEMTDDLLKELKSNSSSQETVNQNITTTSKTQIFVADEPKPQAKENKGGLSPELALGIGLGSGVTIAVIAGGVFLYIQKRKSRQAK